MRTVAFVPIKLNNQRLPGKNLLPLGGRPLCEYIFEALLEVKEIDDVYAYCSDDSLCSYLPSKVKFLKRDEKLDGDYIKGNQIYESFINEVNADIYILAHATSPFTKPSSISHGLSKVLSGDYDSALAVEKKQTFAWFNGKPLNYKIEDIPRTQEIEPVWLETSSFFIFKKELFIKHKRRVGFAPFLVEIKGAEAIDIDEADDYKMAQMIVGDCCE